MPFSNAELNWDEDFSTMIRWDLVKSHKRGTFLLQASGLYLEVAVEDFLWRGDPAFQPGMGSPCSPFPRGALKAVGARLEQAGVPCPTDSF